eukprot:4099084-Prymnesium_polylepis.2
MKSLEMPPQLLESNLEPGMGAVLQLGKPSWQALPPLLLPAPSHATSCSASAKATYCLHPA